jgi:hypothetical protein
MSAPDRGDDGLKNGLLLTILLDVIAICVGLGLYLAGVGTSEVNAFQARPGVAGLEGLLSAFPFILLGVWLVQFLYLPIAALVAALRGRGDVAKGLLLGLGVSTFAIPTLCFGGASLRLGY